MTTIYLTDIPAMPMIELVGSQWFLNGHPVTAAALVAALEGE